MLQIEKETRDLIVKFLSSVSTNPPEVSITVKGIIVTLNELKEVTNAKTTEPTEPVQTPA